MSLERVFRKFDKDNSGTIDRDELAQGLQALGLEVPSCTALRRAAGVVKI